MQGIRSTFTTIAKIESILMIVVFNEIRNERDTGDPSSILGETKVSTNNILWLSMDENSSAISGVHVSIDVEKKNLT
jgi:hypothetical protein